MWIKIYNNLNIIPIVNTYQKNQVSIQIKFFQIYQRDKV